MNEIIKSLVFESIKEINKDLEIEELYDPDLDTPFFDLVDSLGVLNFILDMEQRLEEEFGRYIQIGNEDIMDATKTPFGTIKKLIEFITEKVENEG